MRIKIAELMYNRRKGPVRNWTGPFSMLKIEKMALAKRPSVPRRVARYSALYRDFGGRVGGPAIVRLVISQRVGLFITSLVVWTSPVSLFVLAGFFLVNVGCRNCIRRDRNCALRQLVHTRFQNVEQRFHYFTPLPRHRRPEIGLPTCLPCCWAFQVKTLSAPLFVRCCVYLAHLRSVPYQRGR